MPRIGTGFIDGSGDLGFSLVDKEFLIESFPQLLNQNKIPTLWTWGRNTHGELGDNTTISRSSPVQTIAGGSDWKFIAIQGQCRMGGIKTDGTLWLWGENAFCGIGGGVPTNTHRSSPVQTLSGGTNWRTLSMMQCGGAATKTDGTLWVWGSNFHGMLGGNNRDAVSCPVQTVSGGNNWVKEAAARNERLGGIKCDGTLWTWGENSNGELGNETQGCWTTPPSTAASSPVQTIAGGTNWRSLSMGSGHNAAIKTDGTLWTWGLNSSAQLGNGTLGNSRSSPIQTISGGTDWKFASASNFGTGAIKTNGTLWTWGNFVVSATALTNNTSSPVQTATGGSNWVRICVGQCGTTAIKTDGSLWSWGFNANGQLGSNNTFNVFNTPVRVADGYNWRNAQISDGSAIAIRDLDSD
jgi:alpha-tubulin suppressor-like RCC1 family protein